MVLFPNCKINLGLNIINKRSDGFHNIETIFYPVQIHDALEMVPSGSSFRFTHSGLFIDGHENLCVQAFDLLSNDFPQLRNVQMHLHKSIPVGAGLGGGSADAAFVLTLLNRRFDLGLSEKKLFDYAAQVGSDCPFFIINQPCFATGRGELLEKIALDLSPYKLVVVYPQIKLSTSWAFSKAIPARRVKSVKEIIHQPVATWKEDLKNDFEEIVFSKYSEIKQIKESLYSAGAVYSSLSGSGSAVYGIFHKEVKPDLSFPPGYLVKESACQA